jgi:hypothetical protein
MRAVLRGWAAIRLPTSQSFDLLQIGLNQPRMRPIYRAIQDGDTNTRITPGFSPKGVQSRQVVQVISCRTLFSQVGNLPNA